MFKKLINWMRHGISPRVSSALEADGLQQEKEDMKNFLIVGLGNPGQQYENTRHNIGFMVADQLAAAAGAAFSPCRYGEMCRINVKNCRLMVLKPFTYMNLSGQAVRYWMNKEKLALTSLLVVVDDLALPLGKLRLRAGGSDGGHNGLKNIAEQLGTNAYARLRFGIGNEFSQGHQVDFVLGKFDQEEMKDLSPRIELAAECVKTFCLSGLQFAMTHFNGK